MRIWMFFILGSLVVLHSFSQGSNNKRPDEIVLRECLMIKSVGQGGRSPVFTDAIEAQIVAGKWSPPKADDTVALPDGSSAKWETATADAEGWFRSQALNGGYAYMSVQTDSEKVMLLDAAGHSFVYVNGEPRGGDTYGFGIVRLPILLRQGTNHLLFRGARGSVRAKLVTPASVALLDLRDTTLPDLIQGEPVQTWGAVLVVNASNAPLNHLYISASRGKAKPTRTLLPSILPLSTRKVGFKIEGRAPQKTGPEEIVLELLQKEGSRFKTLDTAKITLRVRAPGQTYKRTFISRIDGSVQYYAVNPAQTPKNGRVGERESGSKQQARPALVLTCHGAGVEAIGQADAYSGKTWCYIVAPTNRRPYGFDWEDWGRLDALEVLELAQKELQTDPQRTYLTGHSMGGHGAWHLGVTFPDLFAAIGPSAGWISFWSYAGAQRYESPNPIQQMLMRATSPSDTLALKRNYANLGVYVLHGGADDNVPVEQAREMKKHLEEFHHDFVYYEQPGAGHWWDSSEEPGADCVDWAPMFDFFAHHAIPRPESLRQVDFVTASPGVSATYHWLTIEAQIQQFKPSSVSVRYDPWTRRFVGTTDNVARLSISLEHMQPGQPLTVELDGQKIEKIPYPTGKPRLWLVRAGDKWSIIPEPAPSLKGPHRYGSFKDAFRNRVLFVYGTKGTPEENTWAFAKARFDAETFWYRGNASVDVIPDTAFDPSKEKERNVILYGNAETNAAWRALLSDSPVQVRRGLVQIGERQLTGDDRACLFIRPRPGSEVASVGVVSGSGMPGMRLTNRLPYFLSGVAYPDCIVLGPEMLTQGSGGIRALGFFGLDWGVNTGELSMQPTAPRSNGNRLY